jgi:hypothetical protein
MSSKGNRYRKLGYQKVSPEDDRRRLRKGLRKGFKSNGDVVCEGCFELKSQNDHLREQIVNLNARLAHYEKVTKKDVLNAHTPSSKIDYKSNSKEDLRAKKGGAKVGHKGHGREKYDSESADLIRDVAAPMECNECRCKLNSKDVRERTVIESVPIIAQKVVYRCARGICPRCFKVYTGRAPTLPKSLYGNSLIAQAAVMHFIHGITIGKVINILGENVGLGGIIDCFHRLGRIAEKSKDFLIQDYRSAAVKHADETGWRTDGHSGYAWIFCTPHTSIFEFRDTRSSRVPKEVLGTDPLSGVLVVDRYGGYNQMPVDLQYCYAHLLREVEKLEEEFRDEKAVTDFTGRLSGYLTLAMKLRGFKISDIEYLIEAEKLKDQIQMLISTPHNHLGIKRIQQIFTDQRERLYQWAKSREVPAENNRAERELRPTVIARKVSFGSQSDAGAQTRSSITSLLYTVKKRLKDKSIEEWLKQSLDQIATDPEVNIASLIPPPPPSTPSN